MHLTATRLARGRIATSSPSDQSRTAFGKAAECGIPIHCKCEKNEQMSCQADGPGNKGEEKKPSRLCMEGERRPEEGVGSHSPFRARNLIWSPYVNAGSLGNHKADNGPASSSYQQCPSPVSGRKRHTMLQLMLGHGTLNTKKEPSPILVAPQESPRT